MRHCSLRRWSSRHLTHFHFQLMILQKPNGNFPHEKLLHILVWLGETSTVHVLVCFGETSTIHVLVYLGETGTIHVLVRLGETSTIHVLVCLERLIPFMYWWVWERHIAD